MSYGIDIDDEKDLNENILSWLADILETIKKRMFLEENIIDVTDILGFTIAIILLYYFLIRVKEYINTMYRHHGDINNKKDHDW